MESAKKVSVIGLGRFGFFWAGLLKERFEVSVWSRSSNRETPPGCRRVPWEALFQADAVFLCCSIAAVPEVARQMAPCLRPGTVVLDTCSVKCFPLQALQTFLPTGTEILGTHPMFGPDSGAKGVRSLPIVLSSATESRQTFRFWKETFSEMGLSVLALSPEAHDREAAVTQGLTHLIGRVMQKMHATPSQMATRNYSKLLQISQSVCNDPDSLFYQLQLLNPYAAAARKAFSRAIAETESDIETARATLPPEMPPAASVFPSDGEEPQA